MRKTNHYILGILTGLSFFIIMGVVTATIHNSFFKRMIPASNLDFFFLFSSSILIGLYVGIHYHKKKEAKTCDITASGASFGSFFSFACPICNKLLLLVFGTTTLLNYFEPYRPALGFLSIGLLSGSLLYKIKS